MVKSLFKTVFHVAILLCFFVSFVIVSGLVTFELLVKGREITIPNLIGLRITQALDLANKADLDIRLVEKQFNPDVPEDYIINQRPLPGIKVKKGKPIRITLSAGSRLVNVPDLTKKSLRQAQIILHNHGLEVGKVSKVFSNQEMKGLVLNQDPIANEEVRRYTEVNLLVSRGPRYPELIMPDLVGLKVEMVLGMLEELGLNVEDMVTQESDEEEGLVLTQKPLPGAPVNFGDKIRLVISGLEGVVTFKEEGLVYRALNYTVPRGFFRKRVRIILDDEAGSREIYNRIMRPNSDLTLTFGIQGRAKAMIFIDNRLEKEIIFEEEDLKRELEPEVREEIEFFPEETIIKEEEISD